MEQPDEVVDDAVHGWMDPHAVQHSAHLAMAIEALAGEIVQNLVPFAAMAPHLGETAVSAELVPMLCDALVQPSPRAARQFIADRRAEGVTRQGIYLGYICAAARRLGEEWDEDGLSFLDVAVGIGHLHDLMRDLRIESPSQRSAFNARRHAFFATVPGEDHDIGITVAADLFREAGWDIDLETGADHDGLMTLIERMLPAIIGLSLSTERRIGDLVRLVAEVRDVVPLAIIGVAPGATLDEVRIRSLVDIDLVFRDARSACIDLDHLVRLRGEFRFGAR